MRNLNVNDLVTLIILAFFTYYVVKGYRKGFIKQAAFVVNTILSFVLAPVIMPIFWAALNELQVTAQLEEYIQGFLNAYHYSHTASGIGLHADIIDGTVVAADEITRRILTQNAGIIARNIVRAVSYSFGFITIRLLLQFVFHISAFISSLPIIHEFDKAIGALSGGLMTLLSIWVILALMSLLTFIPGVGDFFENVMRLPVIQAIRTVNPFSLLLEAVEMISP